MSAATVEAAATTAVETTTTATMEAAAATGDMRGSATGETSGTTVVEASACRSGEAPPTTGSPGETSASAARKPISTTGEPVAIDARGVVKGRAATEASRM